jgi:hypothetical protein
MRRPVRAAALMGLVTLASPAVLRGAPVEIATMDDAQANALALVTAYHSLAHKRSKLEVRVLEADGSASVARDPVSLFVVVTNNGTSDYQGHVWRLPRGIARYRSLSETSCGVDVRVDVDGPEEPTPKPKPHMLHLCFLSTDGHLSATIRLSDEVLKRAG